VQKNTEQIYRTVKTGASNKKLRNGHTEIQQCKHVCQTGTEFPKNHQNKHADDELLKPRKR
jgi:hypothetical protein